MNFGNLAHIGKVPSFWHSSHSGLLAQRNERFGQSVKRTLGIESPPLTAANNQKPYNYPDNEVFVDPPMYDDNNKHSCKKAGCKRVVINVSGMKFVTQERTLNRLPLTLLGDAEKRKPYWDKKRKEYFFDRHRPSFQAILYYYQSGGNLKRPYEVPCDIFLEELYFFQISQTAIEKYRVKDGCLIEEQEILPPAGYKRKIWLLFELPKSSLWALFISIFNVFTIVLSVASDCVETIPEIEKQYECSETPLPYINPFDVIDRACVIWFTIDYCLRLFACPRLLVFIVNFSNIVDVLSILPLYITVAVQKITGIYCWGNSLKKLFGIMRLIRILRIFKLIKHFIGLRVLVATFKASFKHIVSFLTTLLIFVILASTILYIIENAYETEESTKFTSVPAGFWYSVVTITTVGYGDIVPVTPLGKLVGALIVTSGVIIISLSLPIINTNFITLYRQATGRYL